MSSGVALTNVETQSWTAASPPPSPPTPDKESYLALLTIAQSRALYKGNKFFPAAPLTLINHIIMKLDIQSILSIRYP